ncbi:hypothetical protein M758_8G011200 [Ceratodon purpureus]|uniref:F-box domain-containing protein n=1 Tax=Ceratodon purpureus TaxID=3225 RepID=A0A8T0GXC6_CERPU|nr:hypothetical protein KC19_8G011900 [Ceratodon purpureus]KAG0607229.1 hypothetical protein M758_8G011200 [Ceratodon purpureus]
MFGMVQESTMGRRKVAFGELPEKVIECVLSFLPVPVLCRFRCVCKRWKELLSQPSFHDLRELNGRNECYLFAVRSLRNIVTDYEDLDPVALQTICFFDVHARRWYSVRIHDNAIPRRNLASSASSGVFAGMDNSFICEMLKKAPSRTQTHALVLTDPVAETKRKILVPCRTPWYIDDDPIQAFVCFPAMVLASHRVASGEQIFLLNNGLKTEEAQLYVLEPSTGEWQRLGIPHKELGIRKAVSAVIFRGILYVPFYSDTWSLEKPHPLCVLVSYNPEKETWREVPMNLPTRVGAIERKFYARNLIVSSDRLFLMMWGCNDNTGMRLHTFFAIVEVVICSSSSSSKVSIQKMIKYESPLNPNRDYAGMESNYAGLFSCGYGVPCIDPNGLCSSVLWVNDSPSVQVYNMATGSMTSWYAHPLSTTFGRQWEKRYDYPYDHPRNVDRYLRHKYWWKYMTLNWRNLF